MKRLLFYLIKKFYIGNTTYRRELYKILNEKIEETYNDKNSVRNVYNAYTEFLFANETIGLIKERGSKEQRNMLGIGMRKTFDKFI